MMMIMGVSDISDSLTAMNGFHVVKFIDHCYFTFYLLHEDVVLIVIMILTGYYG